MEHIHQAADFRLKKNLLDNTESAGLPVRKHWSFLRKEGWYPECQDGDRLCWKQQKRRYLYLTVYYRCWKTGYIPQTRGRQARPLAWFWTVLTVIIVQTICAVWNGNAAEEEMEEVLCCEVNKVPVQLKPYEIVTIKIEFWGADRKYDEKISDWYIIKQKISQWITEKSPEFWKKIFITRR